jgi:fibrillarin-like rRNA methylase
LADARRHEIVGAIQPQRVDWLFQDVAQASQVDIFISACKRFLNKGGSGLFSLKAASERWDEDGERAMFEKVANMLLNSGMEIVEQIDLAGYEENHMLFHCRNI